VFGNANSSGFPFDFCHALLKAGPHCLHVAIYLDGDLSPCRRLHVDIIGDMYRRRYVEAMFDSWKDSLTIYAIYLINVHVLTRSTFKKLNFAVKHSLVEIMGEGISVFIWRDFPPNMSG